MIRLKADWEIDLIRAAGEIVALTLEALGEAVRPGVTTRELNDVADATVRSYGAQSAFKGYRGFPASICTAVNEQVVHGVPGPRRLRIGDIVGVDVGVKYKGYYADGAATFAVDPIDPAVERLMRVTEEALYVGILQARPENRLSDISHAIQRYVEAHGFSVVRDLVGHGVGFDLHEEPQVPNYGRPGRGHRLRPGMVLAIEPMVNMGRPEVEILQADGWTAVALDRLPSAHYEHTVAITHGEPAILTRPPEAKERLLSSYERVASS